MSGFSVEKVALEINILVTYLESQLLDGRAVGFLSSMADMNTEQS